MPLQLLLWIKQMDTTRREWFIFSYNGNEKQGSTGLLSTLSPGCKSFTTSPSPPQPPPPPQRPSPTTATNCPPQLQQLLLLPTIAPDTPSTAPASAPYSSSGRCSQSSSPSTSAPGLPPLPPSTTSTTLLSPCFFFLFQISLGPKLYPFLSHEIQILSRCADLKLKTYTTVFFWNLRWDGQKNCTFVIYVWGLALLSIVGNSCLAN